ncbi:hypothetical protein ACFE04_026680 [Oxalis oulophora]
MSTDKKYGEMEASLNNNNGNNVNINGFYNVQSSEEVDQFLPLFMELNFQNEYFKSQFHCLNTDFHQRIESLTDQLNEEKHTRIAAQDALNHLQTLHSQTDATAQDLAAKLTQAQQNLDREIKQRGDKYNDLDSKFTRLHKRAKQRIQDIQKEKDDLEARFRDLTESSERASSQCSALEQDLERTRQQAKETLKAMDGERQQLRTENNKLRDNIEEVRRELQSKDNAIEPLQHSLSEKEQMLEDMRGLLNATEEKSKISLAEISAKHQKNVESLEAQIAEALSDRSKATETISALQVLVAEKESKIAETEAASTGEAARLRAAVETSKGEIAHLKSEHEKEKESWEVAIQALKTKLGIAESNCTRAEIEAAKMRSHLESQVYAQTQLLSSRNVELIGAKEEISRLQSEFSSYKIRAHALLQKKDQELAGSKNSEELEALEEGLKEAEREISLVSAERDRVFQDLQIATANHDKDLSERDAALNDAEQQIKRIEMKLDSAIARHQSEKETWEINIQNVEETWRFRCEALKAENEASSGEELLKEIEELKLRYRRLKEEHDSFRDLADRMIGDKDNEISKLLLDNKNLQQSLEHRQQADDHMDSYTTSSKQDAPNASLAEQQILILARQQAQREEELAQSQRHILALQEELEELEHENRLHNQQVSMLKEELRSMDRTKKREGVDLTYLKNVILKLLETGEVEALLPVVAMLLQFSPEELRKCQQAYLASAEASADEEKEASGSSLSLFSRFSFS